MADPFSTRARIVHSRCGVCRGRRPGRRRAKWRPRLIEATASEAKGTPPRMGHRAIVPSVVKPPVATWS